MNILTIFGLTGGTRLDLESSLEYVFGWFQQSFKEIFAGVVGFEIKVGGFGLFLVVFPCLGWFWLVLIHFGKFHDLVCISQVCLSISLEEIKQYFRFCTWS